MRIAIIGQGYVGRSIAEASVGAGHSVIGFDTDASVISLLQISGDFQGTTDPSLIGSADVAVIAVPTPLDEVRKPDLSAVKAACKTIIENIKKPIIGYIGALYKLRLDLDLIEFIAKSKPEWNIVLIGPEDDSFRQSPLHKLSNVYFLGLKDSKEFHEKAKQSGFYLLYIKLFGSINDDITFLNNCCNALASYMSSSEFNSFTSKFDYYLQGKVNLSEEEEYGYRLFKDTTKGKCASCHIADPDPISGKVLFTDYTYDNIGVPANLSIPKYYINLNGKRFVDLCQDVLYNCVKTCIVCCC
jgi:glycosyltransferase involved in cell wall biosynthesis